ncbi:MAG TPA: hypothetical protein ENI55_01325 [Alphaproteobacteria bacterium]|nr:hypothetical protein [Alphaproteobacteria bacterium]
MALVKRGILLLTATLILAACTRDGGVSSYLAGGCADASAKRFEGVDWDKVRQIEMRIRQDEYSPMVVTLTQGQAYIMSIKNDDDDNHNFRATEFFRSVAMAKASIGDEVFENGCMDAVSLEPGQAAELRFIAVRTGRYDFEDNSLLLALSNLGGASGSIAIQPKRVVYTPPVRVPDKKPAAAPGNEPAPPGDGLFGPPPTIEPAPPGDGLFGAPPIEPAPRQPVTSAPSEDLFGPPEPVPGAQPKEKAVTPPPDGGEPSTKAEPKPTPEPGTPRPPVANSAKPNNDIFGEPIEIEPIGPDTNLPVAPQEPNDDIFTAPLEQSMA